MKSVSYNRQRHLGNITFGNILLTLLVVGTFVVGGLMFKLYQELTKTPEKTAQMHQEQKQVEVMTPNTKSGTRPVYRDSQNKDTQKVASNPFVMPAEDATAFDPDENIEDNIKKSNMLVAPAPKKSAQTKKAAPKENTANEANATKNEIPLYPTNVQRPVKETNHSNEKSERPLKPNNIKLQPKPSNEAIDQLF